MSGRFRGADSIQKLLKIARADAEVMRLDLADVDRARTYAVDAIDGIAAEMSREEAASQDAAAFSAYADAMRERRFNLTKTLDALDIAREQSQAKLTTALAEIVKLERLADINARDALTARRRREARIDADNAGPQVAAQKARGARNAATR